MKLLFIFVFFTYFALSGYTIANLTDGTIEASDRIVYADYVVFIIAFLTVLKLRIIRFSSADLIFLAYLTVSLVGVFGSRNPDAGVVELLILFFTWATSVLLFHFFINSPSIALSDVITTFVYSSTVLAVLGLIKFFYWREMFGTPSYGGVVGTFRNTGQSGAYFGIALAIFIPAIFSGLIKRSYLNMVCIATVTVAIMLTFKRASLIGLFIGILVLAVKLVVSGSAKDRKTALFFLAAIVVASPLLYLTFQYSIDNVEMVQGRFNRKFNENSVEDFSEGFLADNLDAALAAISDHPFLGAGLGNIIGQYTSKYEIHSTYLSVLANTGLLGFALYAIFMGLFVVGTYRDGGKNTVEERFLSYIFPFILGLGVSWTYTYHLRKREFWILFFIIAACRYVVNQNRRTKNSPLPAKKYRTNFNRTTGQLRGYVAPRG
jgi:O-antigen ligase